MGPRAIILNQENQVLLVKHTYEPYWFLPGGGVKKGETVKEALIRELNEEVGIIPTEEPKLFGIYFHIYMGVHDYPIVFIIKHFNSIKTHSYEIEQMAWFDYHNLPELVSPGTKRRLDEYFSQNAQSDRW
ncbi:NUDIX domain-containing protein [Legionella sp. WA2024007413]